MTTKLLRFAYLLIIIGLVLVLYIVIRDPNGIGKDLLVNLLADIVAVVVALFTIDRITKERANAQSLPAKCLIYARLLDVIDEFLINTLPSGSYNLSTKIYKLKYYDIYAVPLLEPLDSKLLTEIPILIKNEIKGRKSLDIRPLASLKKHVNEILDRSILILESEPSNLLLQLAFVFLSIVPTDANRFEQNSNTDLKHSRQSNLIQNLLSKFQNIFGQAGITRITGEQITWLITYPEWTIPKEEISQDEIIQWLSSIVINIIHLRNWLYQTITKFFVDIDLSKLQH